MPKRRHRGMERRIALERMTALFRLAESEALRRHAGRARRYVELARRLGMRYNVRVPREFKRRYCRKCHAFLVPGVNCRVRVSRGKITSTCALCGDIRRFAYVREQAARRAERQ